MRFSNNNKSACIDLGSNLCRMLIGFSNKNKSSNFSILKSIANVVKLGDKVYQTGFIQEESIKKTITFLNKCTQIANQYNVKHIECVVTAACRLASNKFELLDRIKRETGLTFRVIDPDEEIYLSSMGCLEIMPCKYCYVIDMGGCSTEIGLAMKHNNSLYIKEWISLPIGVLRFIENDIQKILDNDTENIIKQFGKRCMRYGDSFPIIIAKSSIMSTLANHMYNLNDMDIRTIHGKIIPTKQSKQFFKEIITNIDNSDHITHKNLSTKGSSMFMQKLFNLINIDVLILSNAGLREGLLSKICSNFK